MRKRPRSISISSGKGGTGKTMLTANLGIAIANQGYDVTILDGDLGMANLGLVMGINNCSVTFLDVLRGEASPNEATYENFGVKIIPTGFRFEDTFEILADTNEEHIEEIIKELLRETNFLLIDAPAGITDATVISIASAREMLPITNPNYSSLVDCYKTIRLANVLGSWTRGLVINKTGKSSDVSQEEIEHFMGKTIGSLPILAGIPEDPKVQEAEREEVPVTIYEPESRASIAIHDLAKVLVGESKLPYNPYEESEIDETVKRLSRALTGQRT
ncbi:MAG: cell division ATPase MinD [Hadesarchaea archaeon]|nr:cell division ATPase MinD [Hadesarchaea archaeon]